MTYSYISRKRIRNNFGKISDVAQMPNLIEIQRASYDRFLQYNGEDSSLQDPDLINNPNISDDYGLSNALKSIFPLSDYAGTATLEYVSHSFGQPKYDVPECRQRGINYAAPLRAVFRIIVWDIDDDNGSKEVKDIKEQEVYVCDIPLMTENGTFIINGTERVIVSQMHRSPGVFFDHDHGKNHSSGKLLYNARVIPYRGSWLDFEFDAKDIIFCRIDRRRKFPATVFLKALGYESSEILSYYYNKTICKKAQDGSGWIIDFDEKRYKGVKLDSDLIDGSSREILCESGKKITARTLKELKNKNVETIFISNEGLIGQFISDDIFNDETGEIFLEAGEEITEASIELLAQSGIDELSILDVASSAVGAYIRNTLVADRSENQEDALFEIYRVMRPGEPPTVESAKEMIESLFFSEDRYDLSEVGRVKINSKFNLDIDITHRVLHNEDVMKVVGYLSALRNGNGETDDIDHLGNRRVRSVGELMENQIRIGLVRMEKNIVERLNSVEIDTVMPHDVINAKPVAGVIRDFYSSSQLSQFMDQTNPLSEITHKRRLSALGPGGLTRDRAGFEVRDVHATHYGRICPIETPEGPNIGLINSMATYSNVNKYGFIETPYRKVVDGQVIDSIEYLSALDEGNYIIAQANSAMELDEDGRFTSDLISCRFKGDFIMARPEDINYMDVSPKQLVSVASSLIPFLENDDANRALMGSNMQRQAVPLLKAEAPLVGTGMEAVVAKDSGATIVARNSGVVAQLDAMRIVIKNDGGDSSEGVPGVDIYKLRKFQRSNQNTCINQKPIVKVGDAVKVGDVIADGPSTDLGELALGKNVLVAFMPWNGYNFEDSILISERIVRDDVYTSIHIEEFEIVARDTKIGPEEVTRDIPNVGEEALRHLDEVGIVHVGADVKAGDILVGRVTPKNESPMTPEEKLLRAIFGEKASDVRDTSLRVPPGVAGNVVGVRVFSRRGVDKDERTLALEKIEISRLQKDRDDAKQIIANNSYDVLVTLLKGQKIAENSEIGDAGQKVTKELIDSLSKHQLWKIAVDDSKVMAKISTLKESYEKKVEALRADFENKVEKLQSGDDLQAGVLKMIKVFVAVKRKLQPGDKMAGRHGNKGVISKIIPLEDMPYLEDGTPVDIVLNPLGVPSRMNVGQILETHMGWASAGLGKKIADMLKNVENNNLDAESENNIRGFLQESYHRSDDKAEIGNMKNGELIELAGNLSKGIPIATPVFDGAKEDNIVEMLDAAGLDISGQQRLIDGRTGEYFDRKITVGYIYMLKLHHLVDDKIHARSVGPYSLVTQQPLGGKSQFGGQRFGEMECWALQAYGAAYTLQEMLTVKSDDVVGRSRIYESIVRGDHSYEAGIPESFHVMVKELRALGLNVELIEESA